MGVALLVREIVSPFVLVAGIFGNVVNVIVMTRLNRRNRPYAKLVTASTVSDVLLLILTLTPSWIDSLVSEFDHRPSGEWLCKVDTFFKYSLIHMSSWYVAATAAIRVDSVVRLHSSKTRAYKKMAAHFIKATVVYAIVWQLSVFIFDSFQSSECFVGTLTQFKTHGYGLLIVWANFIHITAVTSIVIIISNVILFVRLRRTSEAVVKDPTIVCKTSPMRQGKKHDREHKDKKKAMMKWWLKSLVVISCKHIVLVGPMVVVQALKTTGVLPYVSPLAWTIIMQMVFINSSTQFYINYLTGTKFKKEMWKVVYPSRSKHAKLAKSGSFARWKGAIKRPDKGEGKSALEFQGVTSPIENNENWPKIVSETETSSWPSASSNLSGIAAGEPRLTLPRQWINVRATVAEKWTKETPSDQSLSTLRNEKRGVVSPTISTPSVGAPSFAPPAPRLSTSASPAVHFSVSASPECPQHPPPSLTPNPLSASPPQSYPDTRTQQQAPYLTQSLLELRLPKSRSY